MAKGQPPRKPRRVAAPKVLGENKELGEALAALNRQPAGIRRAGPRRRAQVPSVEQLTREVTPVLGVGRRTPGVGVLFGEGPPPTGEREPTEAEDEVGGGQQRDRTEYLSPPNSVDPARPRAREASYNPDTRTMRVVFRNGGTYEYFGVPHQTWRALKKNGSFGQTFDRLVKDVYAFNKASF